VSARPYAAVFGVALVVRLAAAVATGGLWDPELFEYSAIARNMLAGQGFTYGHMGMVYHSYSPPLYPWILAAGMWLTGSIVPVMLLQAVAGAALASIAAAVAGRLFGGWMAAVAAGALVAFHPGLVYYNATKAHPLTFDAFFFTLAVFLLLRLAERPGTRRALEFGVVVGVGALSRSTLVILLPVAGLWLLASAARPARLDAVRLAVVAGLCAAAVIVPWTIRTSLQHGRFVFMLTTDSEVFWRGNNPNATGHSYIDAEHIVLNALPPDAMQELLRQPDELAQAEWFQERANTYIRENPATFVRMTLLKFVYFWSYSPQTGVLYPRGWLAAYLAYYAVSVLLALAGIWTLAHAGSRAIVQGAVVGGFLLALSGLQSLYYVEGRHRWAVEPLLLAFSGGGAAALAQRRYSPVAR
jgi:4-amino-4-deoxy-L-arabinose transferase-like glycosyltransferase